MATQWLATASESQLDDPFEQFIGAFSGNVPDWADRHDEYIGQGLMAQLRDSEETHRGDS